MRPEQVVPSRIVVPRQRYSSTLMTAIGYIFLFKNQSFFFRDSTLCSLHHLRWKDNAGGLRSGLFRTIRQNTLWDEREPIHRNAPMHTKGAFFVRLSEHPPEKHDPALLHWPGNVSCPCHGAQLSSSQVTNSRWPKSWRSGCALASKIDCATTGKRIILKSHFSGAYDPDCCSADKRIVYPRT